MELSNGGSGMTEKQYVNITKDGSIIMEKEKLFEKMKPKIKEHLVLKKHLDKMIADGFTEEQAKDIMISAWLNKINGDFE